MWKAKKSLTLWSLVQINPLGQIVHMHTHKIKQTKIITDRTTKEMMITHTVVSHTHTKNGTDVERRRYWHRIKVSTKLVEERDRLMTNNLLNPSSSRTHTLDQNPLFSSNCIWFNEQTKHKLKFTQFLNLSLLFFKFLFFRIVQYKVLETPLLHTQPHIPCSGAQSNKCG